MYVREGVTAVRRAFCLLCCLLFLPSAFFFSAGAADAYDYPEPEVLQIDLVMQPYRYLRMIHSSEKQKYEAVVSINGGEMQQIGVQVRGSGSLKEGMEMPSKRIPMELCFDYADRNGTFRGNPSLKLVNCLTPARVLTQLVAMEAFAFLGIPTPRVTPAFIRINDTDFGVYLAVEDLNEAFAEDRFGSGASLYRPLSPKDGPEETETFLFDLVPMVTKTDGGSDTIDRYVEARERGEDLEPFYDVDEFLRFMACETFILNDDGFIFYDRNFYLADDHGKLKLLPWDKDDVFSMFTDLKGYREMESRCNTLFQKLTENGAYYAKYVEYIRRLNDEFLRPDRFLPWLESYIRLLSPYLERDGTIQKFSDDVLAELTTGNALYNTMTGNLLLTFQTYHDQAEAVLDGRAESFSIPPGAALTLYQDEHAAEPESGGRSVIFRVCAGYWRLQRQAFLHSEGKTTLVIGVFFAAVFILTLICVYRPRRSRRRDKHTGGTST